MLKLHRLFTAAVALTIGVCWAGSVLARTVDAGPVRDKGSTAGTAAFGKIRKLLVHDVGNVRMTLSNWGEQGNPDGVPGYSGFEFPLGAETDFLYSAGIWIAAVKSGEKLVSTGTDGDNGTNEFAPSFDRYVATSKLYDDIAGDPYIKGAKEIDDDDDWTLDDDLDGDGKPSTNWDGGLGAIGRDDDGDGLIDEELANGEDDDGDGLIDEDTDESGDANGDGNCKYDPEPHIDEDPAGDISADFIDNDFDGLVDGDDPDFDGDAVPGSDDDDGDGLEDEDGNARGTQEYFCVYDDVSLEEVRSPDTDGHTPLNVMVLQRTYAWGEAYAASFVLVDLVIRNIGLVPLTDVYIGLFADPDVAARGESGDPASVDDWNFFDNSFYEDDTTKRYTMMIQGDDTLDTDGDLPGLFAMKIVRTPAPPEELNIAFKNFERVAGGDPETNADKFDMLSDDERNNDPPTAQLGDWRFLMGFGPREGGWFPGDERNLLMPGAELPVTVAYIAGNDMEDLHRNARWAQAIYDNDFQGPAAPDQPKFGANAHPDSVEFGVKAYPDRVRIWWLDNSEASVDPITQFEDFEGYQIQRSGEGINWFTIAQYDIIDTLDDPEFERENLNLGMPYDNNPEPDPTRTSRQGWDWELVSIDTTQDPPDTTWRRLYWYDDYEVLRGWTYYYIVRAFDQGVTGAGVLRTSIGKIYLEATTAYTEGTSPFGNEVEQVFVVPNPYKGSQHQEYGGALDEEGRKIYPRKLLFMNLPATGATINIYTLAGDHVVTVEHTSGIDLYTWDMRNKYDQEIVSGIYYYVVEGWSGGQRGGGPIKIDKFVVLK